MSIPPALPAKATGISSCDGREPDPVPDEHDQGEQRGDRAVEGDQGREQRRRQADGDQHPGGSGPGVVEQPSARPGGHAGGVDGLADHEEGGDEDDHRVAEAGDRLVGGDQPRGPEGEGGQDRDHADGEPVPHEEGDDQREDDQRRGRIVHRHA
jgi:hypothetical protein